MSGLCERDKLYQVPIIQIVGGHLHLTTNWRWNRKSWNIWFRWFCLLHFGVMALGGLPLAVFRGVDLLVKKMEFRCSNPQKSLWWDEVFHTPSFGTLPKSSPWWRLRRFCFFLWWVWGILGVLLDGFRGCFPASIFPSLPPKSSSHTLVISPQEAAPENTYPLSSLSVWLEHLGVMFIPQNWRKIRSLNGNAQWIFSDGLRVAMNKPPRSVFFWSFSLDNRFVGTKKIPKHFSHKIQKKN